MKAILSSLHVALLPHRLKGSSKKIARERSACISIEWRLVSYIPIIYVSAYHNAMADLPERRTKEPESLLRGSSPPKAVRRRSSRRDRNGASRGGDLDENPDSFFVISPPHEPLESAPRISTPTLPQEPGFINGADYIPFVDIQDEYDPDASSILNPKKRKLDEREREERGVTKQGRGGDRRGRDHLHTPWMRHVKVDPSDSVSAM